MTFLDETAETYDIIPNILCDRPLYAFATSQGPQQT